MDAPRSRRPLVGVTAGEMQMAEGAWAGHRAIALTEHYTRALRAAGARPIVLGPQDPWGPQEVTDLDALVLTGGTDIDPAAYGQAPLPTDLAPNPERDAFEISLYRAARRASIPVVGICRGLQIIALADGGRLHRHLPVDLPAHPRTGEQVTAVDVEIDAASDLALAVGTRARVAAFHHQGVAEAPASLRVVARHASGLPLALEARGGAPVIAVQWHPELDARERRGEGILGALVATASNHLVGERTAPAGGLRWGVDGARDEERG